jgi:hypothetical protein
MTSVLTGALDAVVMGAWPVPGVYERIYERIFLLMASTPF